MLRQHFKIAFLLLILLTPLTIFGGIVGVEHIRTLARGNYFFEQTRSRPDIFSISITFPNGKSVSVEKKDSFWHIKEADDYYASFTRVNALVKLIRDTVIYRADKARDDTYAETLFANSVHITSRDIYGNIVDVADIAPLRDGNKFHNARLNNDGFIYQLIGDFSLSSNVMDWVQMPLFAWDNDFVKSVHSENFEVYRRFRGDDFRNDKENRTYPHVLNLINNFLYLGAEEIKHASTFDLQNYQKSGYYEITLFGGLLYQISIYNKGDEYWLSVRLTRGGIINQASLKILKENSMLYDGWFFKINADKGQLISGFVL